MTTTLDWPSAPAADSVALDEPRVLGETHYDRVTSLLMAIVLGAILVVGWLALIYATNQAYGRRVSAPLEIIEVFGGGGGDPEGTPGSTEKVDLAGANAATMASNNEEPNPADFEEPSVQQAPGGIIDAVADSSEALPELDLGAVMPRGGPVATGKRASKIGTGGPGLGFGPGDGGVSREQRWSIIYNNDQNLDDYARQLDAFGVELAVVAGKDQLVYVRNFANDEPTKRFGNGQGDDRLYFLWQGRGRKTSDLALLKKADVDVGGANVFQFYNKQTEEKLAQLERRYKGRQPAEIRVTRFGVVPDGGGYDLVVVAQEPLR